MQDEAAGGPLLLAPSGAVLALRYELRPPFVAWLARQAQLLAEGAAPACTPLPCVLVKAALGTRAK